MVYLVTNEETAGAPAHYGYISKKSDYLTRLRRIEGQARGLQRMVEDEKYCIDILTQVSAMTKALQSVSLGLLEEHLSHCVVAAAQAGGPEADEKIREATEAIARLVGAPPTTAPPIREAKRTHHEHRQLHRRRHDLRPLRDRRDRGG